MTIEIVSFPIKKGDFPWLFVCLPEGTQQARPYAQWLLPSGPVAQLPAAWSLSILASMTEGKPAPP